MQFLHFAAARVLHAQFPTDNIDTQIIKIEANLKPRHVCLFSHVKLSGGSGQPHVHLVGHELMRRERLARERAHEHRELAARRVDKVGPSRANG